VSFVKQQPIDPHRDFDLCRKVSSDECLGDMWNILSLTNFSADRTTTAPLMALKPRTYLGSEADDVFVDCG